jgi:hypothetical protein
MADTNKSRLADELVGTISSRAGGSLRRVDDERSGPGNVNRREHQRFLKPTLRVGIGHTAYPTRDWSFGGTCLMGVPGEVRVGATYPVAVVIGQRQFPATAQVRRHTASARQVGLQFTQLPPETRAALGRLARP